MARYPPAAKRNTCNAAVPWVRFQVLRWWVWQWQPSGVLHLQSHRSRPMFLRSLLPPSLGQWRQSLITLMIEEAHTSETLVCVTRLHATIYPRMYSCAIFLTAFFECGCPNCIKSGHCKYQVIHDIWYRKVCLMCEVTFHIFVKISHCTHYVE